MTTGQINTGMSKMENRREFLAKAAVAAAAAFAPVAHAAKPPVQPNILIIHTDEHRFDCLGASGNAEIRTPAIDSLAKDGVRFTNSFCPYPVCTPSRYSLLSGLWVHEHLGASNRCTLPPGTDTFPSLLRQAGYRTKAVGKMHFTPTYLDLGFQELELAEQDGPGRFDDDYHRHLKSLDLVDALDLQDQRSEYRSKAATEYWDTFGAQRSNLPEEHHSTTWIADRAMRTLESWTSSGNMLLVGFIKPHHPFDPPAPWDSRYDPANVSLLPGWTDAPLPRDIEFNAGYFPHVKLTATAMKRVTALYYATISQIDFHVNRMVQLVKAKGLYDDTLIIFTADHGDYMGFHHLLLKGNLMYDPVIKVPLIIKFPGGARHGTTSNTLVSNVDLAPTILSQAGCRPGKNMHGLDLLQRTDRPIVFAESGNQLMARTQRHKLIMRTTGKTPPLFFDLQNDPREIVDQFGNARYRTEIERLSKAINLWRGSANPVKPYLDEKAPVINQPNVPRRDDNHHQEMIDYFQKKMAEWKHR